MNFLEKQNLVNELLPLVNEMAAAERVGKIICEIIKPVTHADLMALSDLELEELQKLVNASRSAKKAEENGKKYQKHFSETPAKDYKIIC